MKKFIFSLLVVLGQVAHSQTPKDFGNFTSVKAYDRINVTLVSSNDNEIQIKDDNPDVEIVNKNGELKIRMTPARIMQGDKVYVTVYYKNIKEVQASQGAKISSDDTMEAEKLSVISNEGSVLNIKVNTDFLTAKANSGGVINITGNTENQDVLVNSGAFYNGKDLESETVSVTANAGGEADIFASKSINAKTRAGGTIIVYGSPKDRNTKNVIGGKIIFK